MKIAIDGPSGSGKSTLAKKLSEKLGIVYLDTGAMYRACALQALRLGISPKSEKDVEKMIQNLDLRILFEKGVQRVFLHDEDVSEEIRQPKVSLAASDISSLPAVRVKLVEMQRKIASTDSVVLDGRDIGSYVLPDAEYKFFLVADAEVRAQRRMEELRLKNISNQTFDEILADIQYRDHQDSTRAFVPLKKTPDAIVVDTSGRAPDETLQFVLSYIDVSAKPDKESCRRGD